MHFLISRTFAGNCWWWSPTLCGSLHWSFSFSSVLALPQTCSAVQAGRDFCGLPNSNIYYILFPGFWIFSTSGNFLIAPYFIQVLLPYLVNKRVSAILFYKTISGQPEVWNVGREKILLKDYQVPASWTNIGSMTTESSPIAFPWVGALRVFFLLKVSPLPSPHPYPPQKTITYLHTAYV